MSVKTVTELTDILEGVLKGVDPSIDPATVRAALRMVSQRYTKQSLGLPKEMQELPEAVLYSALMDVINEYIVLSHTKDGSITSRLDMVDFINASLAVLSSVCADLCVDDRESAARMIIYVTSRFSANFNKIRLMKQVARMGKATSEEEIDQIESNLLDQFSSLSKDPIEPTH